MSVTRGNELLQEMQKCYAIKRMYTAKSKKRSHASPLRVLHRKKKIGYDRFLGKPSETLNQR